MPRGYLIDEATARWATEQANRRTGTQNMGPEQVLRDPVPERVFFRNDSGETVPAHGVLRVTGYVDAQGRHMVTVAKPASTLGTFIVNSWNEVASGEYGWGYASGQVRVLYDSADAPSNGQVYGVDGFKARTYPSGKPVCNFVMLGIVDSTNKIAVANFEHPELLMIQAPANGIPGRAGSLVGSASCTVAVLGTVNSMLSTTSVSVTVFNWSKSAVCKTGDRYGIAGLCSGKWKIIAEDCNDTGSTIGGGTMSTSGGTIGAAIDTSTTAPASVTGIPGEVRYRQGTTGSVGSGGI